MRHPPPHARVREPKAAAQRLAETSLLWGHRLAVKPYHAYYARVVDISAVVLEPGREFLREAGLEAKRPALVHTTDLSLRELQGQAFDFILAQSVLTHMPEREIGELFRRIPSVMAPEGRYTTYFERGVDRPTDVLEFHYPFTAMEALGRAAGLRVEQVPEFRHPRHQQMLRLMLAAP